MGQDDSLRSAWSCFLRIELSSERKRDSECPEEIRRHHDRSEVLGCAVDDQSSVTGVARSRDGVENSGVLLPELKFRHGDIGFTGTADQPGEPFRMTIR